MTDPKQPRRRVSTNPTIAEVSALAGVSPMTVSRVVNGEVRVKESTRQRVTDAIAQLGYRPNAAARQLAGKQVCRIALLYNNPSSAYLSELLVGAMEQAAESSAELILERCRPSDIPTIGAALAAQRIAAVILPPPLSDNAELLYQMAEMQIVCAMLATNRGQDNCHLISLDDEAAAHAMVTHLIGKGHRRIGFIKGDPNQTASAQRELGFRRALADHGLPVSDKHLAQGDFSFRSGFLAAEEILSAANPPTAIFASNDDMAAAVVAAAHRFDLKVPDQLSVCGFDDTSMAVSTWPELSTIKQPVYEMARRAVELLVKSASRKRAVRQFAAQHMVLDFQLIERGSVAPPRQRD